jgi:putative ABC transport system permease protein
MYSLLGDIKYTLIAMNRDRGFAAAALVTLALGIGATTAVFSVVYGVLLRPLPYPESERLVRVYEEHPGAPRPPGEPPLTNTTMYAWRARTQTVEGLAAYYAREYTVSLDGDRSFTGRPAARQHPWPRSPRL